MHLSFVFCCIYLTVVNIYGLLISELRFSALPLVAVGLSAWVVGNGSGMSPVPSVPIGAKFLAMLETGLLFWLK